MRINTWNGLGRENVEFYYCSETCKEEIEKFSDYVNKNAAKFLRIIVLVLFTMIFSPVIQIVTKNELYVLLTIYVATVLLGATIIKYPFATPQTNQWMGIRKAVLVARILGVVIMLGSIVMIVLHLLDFFGE